MEEKIKKTKTEMRHDLKNMPTSLIEEEINKRQSAEQERLSKSQEEQNHKKWLNRPYCDFVGRAYGSAESVSNHTLCKINISGNMGNTYEAKYNCPSSVHTYFHNVWGQQIEREFKQIVETITKYFLETKVEFNPNIIAGLISLSTPRTEMQKEDWDKAAIEKLCEFSIDELKHAVEQTHIDWGLGGHGQEALLKKALKVKIELNIPDKKRITLPTEWKVALSVAKMKGEK